MQFGIKETSWDERKILIEWRRISQSQVLPNGYIDSENKTKQQTEKHTQKKPHKQKKITTKTPAIFSDFQTSLEDRNVSRKRSAMVNTFSKGVTFLKQQKNQVQ